MTVNEQDPVLTSWVFAFLKLRKWNGNSIHWSSIFGVGQGTPSSLQEPAFLFVRTKRRSRFLT